MAITIPTPRTSTNVGRPALLQADTSAESMGAGVAQAVGQAAVGLANVFQQKQRQVDLAAVQEQSNALDGFTNNALYGDNGLYTKKGKSALGASDELLQSFDTFTSEQLAALTNEDQRKAYQAQVTRARTNLQSDSMRYQLQQSQAYEAEQQAAYLTNSKISAANNYQNEDRVNQDIGAQIDSIKAFGKLHGQSDEDVRLNILQATSVTREAVISRMINESDYAGAEQHLDKYENQIMPDRVDAIRKSINQGRQVELSKNRERLTGELQDYIAYKNAGGEQTKQFDETTLKAVYGDEQGSQVYAEIQDANQFAIAYNQVKFASADELNQIVSGNLPDSPQDFRREQAQFNQFMRAVETRNTQLGKDPAAYTMQADAIKRSYQEYADSGIGVNFAAAQIAEQQRLGVPQQLTSVLPKPMAEEMVMRYQQGGETAAQFVKGIKESFGDYYSNVMRDLNAAGLSPVAQVVAILPPGNAANLLSEADKDGHKVLKETIGNDTFKTIEADVSSSMSDLSETLYFAANGPATLTKIKSATELLAMKYVSMGVPVGDAIERSVNQVVNDRYEFVDGYRVPKGIMVGQTEKPIDVPSVTRGVDSLLDTVKDNVELQIPLHAGMPDDVAKMVYLRNLRITPTTLNDESGVVLMNQNGNAILDANGNPLTYTWDQLQELGKDKSWWGF